MKAKLALAAVAIFLALAGCGSGDDSAGQSSSARAAPGSGAYVLGRWHGALHQKGMPTFSVRVEIRSLSDSGENDVSYSGIRCGGNWAYLGFRSGAYRFREVIDRGAGGACKGVGLVTMAPAGPDSARYAFRGGGIVSQGTLRRRGGTQDDR